LAFRAAPTVRKLRQPSFVHLLPEDGAVSDRRGQRNRPKLATCACRTLPSARRVSTRLTCNRDWFSRNRMNIVVVA
jgi:hypothetical protein